MHGGPARQSLGQGHVKDLHFTVIPSQAEDLLFAVILSEATESLEG